MKTQHLLTVMLHLFDGEGAAAPAVGGAGTGNGAPPTAGKGKSGEYANVRFGKQAGAAASGTIATSAQDKTPAGKGAQETPPGDGGSSTLDEKRRAFRELVSGEYKDIYTEETQRMLDRRLRDMKTLQDRVTANQPIIDKLMQRYGIADGDMKKLSDKLDSDSAFWSEAAEEAGMDVEQYKEMQRLQRENAALMREQRARLGQDRAQQQLQQWYTEAEALKAKFPAFDLEAEIKDKQFTSMLRSGVPMEHAYKVLHWDELTDALQTATAAATEQRVVANVRAKGARPAENGAGSQSGITIKDDVHKLTKKDRAEIARRVARGETISF